MERTKSFVVDNFERILVVILVASMLLIHVFVTDYKVAFLSFYYLPIIVAGFQIGRRGAALSASFVVFLVTFFQLGRGLDAELGAGYNDEIAMTLIPWGGFLILVGYTVGMLAEQRRQRLDEVKHAYMTVLELLTFHIESTERQARGHSFRVASRAAAIARAMGLKTDDVERVRVAGLLHELKPDDPRLTRIFEHFPGETRTLPVVDSMRSALDIVAEYSRYYELSGGDWPVDHLRLQTGTKILAVADAFETLQLPAGARIPMSVWGALAEIEQGEGTTFATAVVAALRKSVTPERASENPHLASV